jgi:O-antigen/teichoic acid export membrane protein
MRVWPQSVTPQRLHEPGLLHNVSRSVVWNAALLPLVAAAGVLLSILVRRSFGLESGVYDVALGVANSILFYSGLGLAGSLPKFLPELQLTASPRAVMRLALRLGAIRLGIVVAILVPLNMWADPLGRRLNLGPEGASYLHVLSALLLGRAALDFAYRVLDSFFRQLAVNMLSLTHGLLDLGLVAFAVLTGKGIRGVIAALGASAVTMAVITVGVVFNHLANLPENVTSGNSPGLSASRVWRLSAVTYLRDLSIYFATPAFASPVLVTLLGGPAPVALFATSYFVASSTVTLVVSGFRGIYRPAFAHVMAAGERAQLHRAFDLVNKLQILAVVPAGIGLAVMVGDYLPLLYGAPFVEAVVVARVLVLLLFAETAMAVALVVLWVDEQYRPVLLAQFVMVASAPLFIWVAGRWGLLASAAVLGCGRLASSALGYVEARRLYGVRYPWVFGAKVTLVSTVMAACLLMIRRFWSTSFAEAIALTLLGAAIVALGLRVARVMGPDELEVLGRASIPGKRWLVRWLAAG